LLRVDAIGLFQQTFRATLLNPAVQYAGGALA